MLYWAAVDLLNQPSIFWKSRANFVILFHFLIPKQFRVLGQRWFQKEFSYEMTFDFTTAEANPEVCLDLNSGTNYIVNITTASSTEISALITIAVQAEGRYYFVFFITLRVSHHVFDFIVLSPPNG